VILFGGSWHSDREGMANSCKVRLVVQVLVRAGHLPLFSPSICSAPKSQPFSPNKMLEHGVCFVDTLKGIDFWGNPSYSFVGMVSRNPEHYITNPFL